MDKKFNEKGEINPTYRDQIIKDCEEHNIAFFEEKLKECRDYLEARREHGWPAVKNMTDLNVECHFIPRAKTCIRYLKDGIFVDSPLMDTFI